MCQLPSPEEDSKHSAHCTVVSGSPKTQCRQALGRTRPYFHGEQTEQTQPLGTSAPLPAGLSLWLTQGNLPTTPILCHSRKSPAPVLWRADIRARLVRGHIVHKQESTL